MQTLENVWNMFKVNKKEPQWRHWCYWRRSVAFIINFEHILYFTLGEFPTVSTSLISQCSWEKKTSAKKSPIKVKNRNNGTVLAFFRVNRHGNRRLGRLLNVLCTFNSCPLSKGDKNVASIIVLHLTNLFTVACLQNNGKTLNEEVRWLEIG